MGTSASYRSPRTTKWNAVRVAISTTDIPAKRSVSEIWNAAGESDLDSAPVIEYYKAWLRAARTVSERMAEQSAPGLINEIVREARHLALEKGAGVSASAAERALQQCLREAAVGSSSLIAADSDSIKKQWNQLASVPDGRLTGIFLGSVVEQLTKFYVARDLPEYSGKSGLRHAADLNQRVDELGYAARTIVSEPSVEFAAHESPSKTWKMALVRCLGELTEMGRSGQ